MARALIGRILREMGGGRNGGAVTDSRAIVLFATHEEADCGEWANS
jgi:hypothetical protein